MASVTFMTTSNTSLVKISVEQSPMFSDICFITGIFNNVIKIDPNTKEPIFGSLDNCSSITIDNINPLQGSKEEMNAVIKKVAQALSSGRLEATFMGRKLVIVTDS